MFVLKLSNIQRVLLCILYFRIRFGAVNLLKHKKMYWCVFVKVI